ncbi:hypothetical protein Lal_00010239 [Lupinus albus]|nr:hypothetical protein Lal_00010239 [Lupinus albus]
MFQNGKCEDPRLNAFKKEWFEARNCLDIGCSSGILTINIAKKFSCQSMLGIDIDPDRVKDANLNLSKTVESISAENKKREVFDQKHILGSDTHTDQVEEANLNLGKVVELESTEKKRKRDQTENLEQGIDDEEIPTRNLSDIVSFKQENFLESEYNPLEQHYDTILCLSVTLWIHLNWGDDGLKTLFQKIWNMLLPNGLFVLEPHKWKTYEHNRNISETATMNYLNIKIRPDKFLEILLGEIGFSELIHLSSVRNRDIMVFQKTAM